MQKYNIQELTEKQLFELEEIAQSLGIPNIKTLQKQQLVYKILDEQAITVAGEQVKKEALRKERKAKKSNEQQKTGNQVASPSKNQNNNSDSNASSKRRGRPPKVSAEQESHSHPSNVKGRGRPPKAKTEQELSSGKPNVSSQNQQPKIKTDVDPHAGKSNFQGQIQPPKVKTDVDPNVGTSNLKGQIQPQKNKTDVDIHAGKSNFQGQNHPQKNKPGAEHHSGISKVNRPGRPPKSQNNNEQAKDTVKNLTETVATVTPPLPVIIPAVKADLSSPPLEKADNPTPANSLVKGKRGRPRKEKTIIIPTLQAEPQPQKVQFGDVSKILQKPDKEVIEDEKTVTPLIQEPISENIEETDEQQKNVIQEDKTLQDQPKRVIFKHKFASNLFSDCQMFS